MRQELTRDKNKELEKLTLAAKENLEAEGLEVVSFDHLRNVRSIFEEPPQRVYRRKPGFPSPGEARRRAPSARRASAP